MTSDAFRFTSTLYFDREWYSSAYLDVALLGMDPEEHFQLIGRHLGRQPNRAARDASGSQQQLPLGQAVASFEWFGEHVSAQSGPALTISEGVEPELRFRGTLAVHLHLFHYEMLEQCCAWLSSIPVPFDLFVSVVDPTIAERAQRTLTGFGGVNRLFVSIVPNRGRDIAPMVVGFGRQLATYDFVGHFHSKKSSHTPGKRDWAGQLGHHLFHSQSHTTRVLNLFAERPDLGLVFPIYHPSIKDQIKWGSNFRRAEEEMRKFKGLFDTNISEEDLLPFPAGSFFLARTNAIRHLLDGAYTLEDFEPEAQQVDGTLAHAIERMFVLVSARSGYTFQQIRAQKPHSLSRAYLSGDVYRSAFLDAVETGACSKLPLHSHSSLADLRITFFTCSTGGYDQPLPFESFVDGADYVFFGDQSAPEQNGHWRMAALAVNHPDRIKAARRHKAQAHRILSGTDIAIWIDGNIAVTADITGWVAAVVREQASFGVVAHPYRNSVGAELTALEQLKIDTPESMRRQVERYSAEGFPDDSLTETNFIIMDLRRQETRHALDIWWSEIERNSRRDQLSFDYACWKAGARKISLITSGLSVRADYHFAYFDHGASRHPKLSVMPALAALWMGKAHKQERSLALSVDVVVCVHNSPDDVARCLHSLALARDGRTRLVIVDDGSDSPTQAVIHRHLRKHPADILVRHDTAQGYTKSANAGMRASRADYVILLNSDTIVPCGWVDALIRAGEANPTVGIVGPLSNAASWQSVPVATLPSGEYAINELPAWMSVDEVAAMCAKIPSDPVYTCPIINGFCFAIKRQVIDQIGYLDEEAFPLGYGEENDYCLRLTEAGLSCGFTTSTYVYHAKSRSFNHERRKKLSEKGWDKLTAKYGQERLQAAVEEMQQHPAFARARTWFAGLTERREPPVKTIAFYLPQFHSFPVNDVNWGAGFSEWRNVVKASARFWEHYQPRLPGELGYYDLRTPETLEAQGKLAQQYGVYGMGVYYYRFGKERLMSAPTDRLLQTPGIGPRFFYIWANEDWTRAWDGRTRDVIKKQDHSFATLRSIAMDLVEAAADCRYIRVDDRPVFMIYQLNLLPDPSAAIKYFRDLVRNSLAVEIVLGTTWNPNFREEWEQLVDFIVQFPPHRTPRLSQRTLMPRESVPGASEEHADFLESYDEVSAQSLAAMDAYRKLIPGVCPDWDNSARRSRNANILIGSSPDKFENWTAKAARKALAKHTDGSIPAPLLFVNAWNEWAEGAVLEPTEKHGRAYLEAFRRGIYSAARNRDSRE
ncbi:glycoside hydrolase family 99-like domain-containing protein [Ensifer aridi]|uniref:glycoside hydrolase family 99-like domain-containing protein n=1 Tax=Ensifer aridi TaxID=1708715 RepID=UPI000614AE01|nr:glycoside hydrolase family 99-like domain-containing protein [Ensifer aridi]